MSQIFLERYKNQVFDNWFDLTFRSLLKGFLENQDSIINTIDKLIRNNLREDFNQIHQINVAMNCIYMGLERLEYEYIQKELNQILQLLDYSEGN